MPDGVSADKKSIVTSAGSLHFDNQQSSVTTQVGDDISVVLDDSGITIASGSAHSIAVSSSGVSVNDDALEVS